MSMISEQIQALRDLSVVYSTNGLDKVFTNAADTIEELSAKLATANMERSTAYYNGGWIPCGSGRVPKHCQQVFITTELFPNVRFTSKATYYTQMGAVDHYEWDGEGFYDHDSEYGYSRREDVIAWMPAEPYKGVE